MQVLVDSNIIIYSLTEKSPKIKASQEFISGNQSALSITHQVILESLRVLTHPKFKCPMNYKKALNAVWTIADALDIISPNSETILVAKELISKYELESNRVFDAYLVATALTNGIGTIATDDVRHFKKFRKIKVVNPFK